MLKYKITDGNRMADAVTLTITNTDIKGELPCYYIDYDEDDNTSVNIVSDENTIEFTAENIFGIQSGSHLIGANKITVVGNGGETINQYDYVEDLIVDSASNVFNTFTVHTKKNLQLEMRNICVETRYNAIQYIDNTWKLFMVDKAWLENNNVSQDTLITTEQAALGRSEYTVPFDNDVDMTYSHKYKVFYYENSSWKKLELLEKIKNVKMEGCLTNDEKSLIFSSFHLYDEKAREIVYLDRDKIYWTKEPYIYFNCVTTHYFTMPKENTVLIEDENFTHSVYTQYGKEKIKNIEYPIVNFWFQEYKDGIILDKNIEIECHIDTDSQLSFNFNNLNDENKSKLIKIAFNDEIKKDSDSDVIWQEGTCGLLALTRKNIMYNNEYVSFDIIYDMSVNTIQIPLLQKFETDLYHNEALKTDFVDIETKLAVNPIMDLEKDVYIPVIYEKTPHLDSDGEYFHTNAKYKECKKIIFNLHFREHRDHKTLQEVDKWSCDRNSFWNGTRKIEKQIEDGSIRTILDLDGRVFQYENVYDGEKKLRETHKKNKYDYFSYFGSNPGEGYSGFDETEDYDITKNDYAQKRQLRNLLKEYQSDTLAYLGFTNNDVKYQKGKLKGSFLRLLFYDSDNLANQNLLHTATIFLDSGNLFSKYIKNIDSDNEYEVKVADENFGLGLEEIIDKAIYESLPSKVQDYCQICGAPTADTGSSLTENKSETTYDETGVRVNREPMRKNCITDLKNDVSSLEDLRLSSQIEIMDKYSSKRSSEGFYFYTYKNNDNGVFPSNIYMRVEFNHAGYGRTIPFMMPYIRKNEMAEGNRYYGRAKKIKTFDDICYDWSDIDYDKGINEIKEEDKVGYGTVRYIKYSYIKLKYRYDKRTQKHVYYLDPDTYGDSVTTDNGHGNNIILNLYEGKIR